MTRTSATSHVARICQAIAELGGEAHAEDIRRRLHEELGNEGWLDSNLSLFGFTLTSPFGGTGTVATVARQLDRRYIYIDQSKEYAAIARKRLEAPARQGVLTKAPRRSRRLDAAPP
jgi:hypothetical protein